MGRALGPLCLPAAVAGIPTVQLPLPLLLLLLLLSQQASRQLSMFLLPLRRLLLRLLLLSVLLTMAEVIDASSSSSSSSSSWGRWMERRRKTIVKGRPVVDQRYFAFQVAIFNPQKTFFCGGSIIAPSFVLTAGHCFSGKTFNISRGRNHWKLNTDPNATDGYYAVGYGSGNLRDMEANSRRVRVGEIWIHQGFVHQQETASIQEDYHRFRLSNDLAILKLVRPLPFSHTVRSISLSPDDSSLPIGSDIAISGWGGMKKTSGPFPDKLRVVTVDHLPNVCYTEYENRAYTLVPDRNTALWYDEEDTMCTGCTQGGFGACSGDSGGPLVVLSSTGGCPLQVGVMSWSLKVDYECGLVNPDKSARISHALSWIETVVGQPVRSTVVPSPTELCDDCRAASDNPPQAGVDCKNAFMYNLTLCDLQAHLSSSFVLNQPRCEGGDHVLTAFIDFHKGFVEYSLQVIGAQLRQGSVIFLWTDKGLGNGHFQVSFDDEEDSEEESFVVNTPLAYPQQASPCVPFNATEGAWTWIFSGCSANHSYAALYMLDAHCRHSATQQISVAVEKGPEL